MKEIIGGFLVFVGILAFFLYVIYQGFRALLGSLRRARKQPAAEAKSPQCLCLDQPEALTTSELSGKIVVGTTYARFVLNSFAVIVCDHGDTVCLHPLESVCSTGSAWKGLQRPKETPSDLSQIVKSERLFRASKQIREVDPSVQHQEVEFLYHNQETRRTIVFHLWDGRDKECYET
jgi:hypothetical protein